MESYNVASYYADVSTMIEHLAQQTQQTMLSRLVFVRYQMQLLPHDTLCYRIHERGVLSHPILHENPVSSPVDQYDQIT